MWRAFVREAAITISFAALVSCSAAFFSAAAFQAPVGLPQVTEPDLLGLIDLSHAFSGL